MTNYNIKITSEISTPNLFPVKITISITRFFHITVFSRNATIAL